MMMKQTEIGLIPDDWDVRALGDVATIIGGGTPSTLNSAYWNGDIQWFTPAELSDSKKYISKSERTITERGLKESSAKLLPKGTVLLTTRASIGITAILENPACTNQGFQSLIAKNNFCNEFLYYVIPLIKNEMLSRASGSTFAEISAKKLSSITFPFPPLAEQQRIAKALSDVDALISTTEKLIQKKKNIKQGAMQNLLTGKKRLPGFGPQTKSSAYKQTELGPIPDDWEVKNLGEICDLINGDRSSKYPKDDEMVSNGIPFINAGHLKEGAVDFDEMDYITRNHYQSLSGAKIREGDILFCLRGSLGKNALVNFNDGAPASSLCVIRHKTINEKLLFQIINSALFEKQIIDANSGSSQPNLSAKEVSNFLIPIPTSKEEQTAIANVLSCMDKEIETLNTKLEKYHNLKTAMMQQLLTGKIRLV